MVVRVALGGISDHGQLAGLSDDDHLLYAVIGKDTYTGNNSASRDIAHGLGRAPLFVVITDNRPHWFWLIEAGYILTHNGASVRARYAVTAVDSTSFYVGNASSYAMSGNESGTLYQWVAYG